MFYTCLAISNKQYVKKKQQKIFKYRFYAMSQKKIVLIKCMNRIKKKKNGWERTCVHKLSKKNVSKKRYIFKWPQHLVAVLTCLTVSILFYSKYPIVLGFCEYNSWINLCLFFSLPILDKYIIQVHQTL